ncbi:MAG TPA: hypothetical protein VEK14_00285 [Rhodomicrobium sp.]|nr:hypothetical protein [Rhodomicrobium sp.]
MDVNTLREQAAACRRNAETAYDTAVKESLLFLARVYDEEADELESRQQRRATH